MEITFISLWKSGCGTMLKIKVEKHTRGRSIFNAMSLKQVKIKLSICGLDMPEWLLCNACVLLLRQQMVSWGISSHTWNKASTNSWTVWGATWCWWMDQDMRSQMWFRSGERVGLSITSIPLSSRNCWHTSEMRSSTVLYQHMVSKRVWESHLSTTSVSTWRAVRFTDPLQNMLQTQTFSLASPDCHVCHLCLVWTCVHLWRAQGTSGEFANPGVL